MREMRRAKDFQSQRSQLASNRQRSHRASGLALAGCRENAKMGNRRAANEGSDSRHRRCNKHSIFPAFCQGWRSNGRSASGPGWSVATQPAGIHNGQFRVDLPPVSNGQGPFFRQFPGCQVERLSEAHGVGRIHDLLSGLRELKHRADAVPVVRPAVHAAGNLSLFFRVFPW